MSWGCASALTKGLWSATSQCLQKHGSTAAFPNIASELTGRYVLQEDRTADDWGGAVHSLHFVVSVLVLNKVSSNLYIGVFSHA